MLGLKRRKKQEGWALTDSDLHEESKHISRWQRLADNNKLWFCCLVVVLLITSFFYYNAMQTENIEHDVQLPKATGTYDDMAHTDFSLKLQQGPRYKELVTDARFVSPGAFRLTVKGTCSADDIDYLSKLAAQKILHEFNTRVVVRTYIERSGNRGEVLAATAQWEPKNYGFVVKFNRDAYKSL